MELNKNKLVSIIVDDTIDVSMLVWALYTLTQQTKYYYVGFEHWFDVSSIIDDEISETLSIRVEVDGIQSVKELTDNLATLNVEPKHQGIHILVARLHEKESNNDMYTALIDASDKVIVLSSFGVPNMHKTLTSIDTIDHFLSVHFEKNTDVWEDVSNLPWDRREYIALNFRPLTVTTVSDKIDLSNDKIYPFSSLNYHLNLQTHLPSICNFIGIPFTELPCESWDQITEIYRKWRMGNATPVLWEMNLPLIVDSIVNGYNLDLSPYNLDIIKESIILHELLYKHNMNIKGYGLSALPTNAKDIHALLEPNFHTLTEY